MSFTMTVPAEVPFVFHSSRPAMPSFAKNSTSSPTRVRPLGEDFPCVRVTGRGSMSLTRTVPAVVPSLAHSSAPTEPLSAWKNTRPPSSGRAEGRGTPDAGPGRMSLTSVVPASVPSLVHNSQPVGPSQA